MLDWINKRRESMVKSQMLSNVGRQLGSVVAIVAIFSMGYAVKTMEGSQEQRQVRGELKAQRKDDTAQCDARLVRNDQDAKARLAERDQLLKDQTGRISEQTALIQTLQGTTQQLQGATQKLTDTTAKIASKQDQSIKLRSREMHTITRAAEDAKVAVDQVNTLTATDRSQINDAVKTGVRK